MNSPFLIVQDFISPLTCEKIIDANRVATPDTDVDGNPKKIEHFIPKFDAMLAEAFRGVVPEIEERYNCIYRGLEQPLFQYYPEYAAAPAEQPGCENSKYVRKKWVMYKDVDLVGFLWLKDYNDNPPLDPRHEVFGGKIEFPVHNFSLVPQRGTLVLFPASPHFITVISPILLGDLYQIKLNVCVNTKTKGRWLYQPENFPGTWQDWMSEYL